jgi:hypothetical protein
MCAAVLLAALAAPAGVSITGAYDAQHLTLRVGADGNGMQAWCGARYRATLTGPNFGTTLAPDAVTST